MFRLKVTFAFVTAVVMQLFRLQAIASPVALQTEFRGVDRCPVDLQQLATETGLKVSAPQKEAPAWKATLQRSGDNVRLSLSRPDGMVVASKSVVAGREPCQAMSEVLTILLAAHVPSVELSMPGRHASPREQPAHWRFGLGSGVSGFSEGAGLLLVGSGQAQIWRKLGVGLRFGAVYQQQHLDSGSASIWSVDAHATAGYLAVGERVSWTAGGLMGARFSHASADGLKLDASATVASFSVGLFADHWWAITSGLSVGAGAAMLFVLPRAAFVVTNHGAVYSSPTPTVDLYLTIGWGR